MLITASKLASGKGSASASPGWKSSLGTSRFSARARATVAR